jgi:tetratricopeptide (TPR) repeat protein
MRGDSEKRKEMTDNPVNFEIDINEFDFEILPLRIDIDLLRKDRKLRERAVTLFYEDHLEGLGGEVRTEIDGDFIKVSWWPGSSGNVDEAVKVAAEWLSKGAHGHAGPLLESLHAIYPDRQDILYNYGMMLSDQGELDKAVEALSRLTDLAPDNADAWNALGIAYMRKGLREDAKQALQKSHQKDPDNPYTLRNLGGLIANDNPAEGLPYLKRAAEILTDDQQTQYGYGLCLLQTGQSHEADAAFKKAMEIAPYSELSEQARIQRTKIAQQTLRGRVPGGLRMDAVMYCLSALEKFEKLGQQKARAITSEIAMLGRGGFDINNPDKKYTLKSLDGEFSGLQLLSYMYVGLKRMEPNRDFGIDLGQEYEAALKLYGEKNG